jgi:DNA-binding winged helix-turn-helix (wHTH) protein
VNACRSPDDFMKNAARDARRRPNQAVIDGGGGHRLPTQVLRFEDFELDRGAYQLRRSGTAVHLERIPLDLLFFLAERRDQLVTREEIIERIWGKGVFLDAANSINAAVRKIRRALGDDADAPRFIATVPAKGYRFIAATQDESAAAMQIRPPPMSLVGREREVAELRTALNNARAGKGGLFLISGESGVGKTRLAQELGTIAHAMGMEVLEGNCTEYDEAIPYLPFVEILEKYTERASGAAQLRMILGDEASELVRLLPKLKRLLPDLPPPLELPAPQARRHLFSCYCDFVARRTREQPTLLVLEDLHWADDSSLALLMHLAQQQPELHLVVVATYRDTELDVSSALAETLEVLLRRRLATAIRLGRLKCEEVAQVLSSLSGRVPPVGVVKEIFEETGGNAFFVEELFRYFDEEHRLYDENGAFHTELKIAETEVPGSVRLVVGRRLTRVNDRTRTMLATAAVIGRLCTLELLTTATQADLDLLLESIEDAEKAGFLLSLAEKSPASVEFSHELVRQGVISGLSGMRQQRLHLEVAEAIERIYSDTLEDHFGELAYHCRRGNDTPKALRFTRLAAEQAVSRAAYVEATSLVEAALKLLETLPEDNERLRAELALRSIENMVAFALFGSSSLERERLIRRMCELGERLGEVDQLLRGLISLSGLYFSRGEPVLGLEFARRCFELADATQDAALLAGAYFTAGVLVYSCGQLREAVSHFEKATVHAGRTDRIVSLTGLLYSSSIACFQAPPLQLLGRISEALIFAEEGLRRARESGHPFTIGFALLLKARLSRYRREPQVVLALSDEVILLAEQSRFSSTLNQGRFNRGWALVELGQLKQGIIDMDWANADIQRMGGAPWLQYRIALLAQAYAKTGHTEKGLAMLNDTLVEVERTGEKIDYAEMLRLKGELLLMHDHGATKDAEVCFRAALEVARVQEARWWELRTTVSLARLQRDTNRSGEARTMLAEIYGWFTEGFDTADLKEAKALLDELAT